MEIPDFSSGEPTYFEMQAFMGTTKHMGGLLSTKELIELCQIDRNSRVLDVGCGVGATACYLAERFGCMVMAVDCLESMAALTEERVDKNGLGALVMVEVADARELPFEDAQYDIVICESVLTFVNEKIDALMEFVRVTRAGGMIGLNEEIWLETPPPQELVEYAASIWGITSEIPTMEGWRRLMEQAGLLDIEVQERKVNMRRESSQIGRYSIGEIWNMFQKIGGLYFRSQAFRNYMRSRRRRPPKGVFRYLGYGLMVGVKRFPKRVAACIFCREQDRSI